MIGQPLGMLGAPSTSIRNDFAMPTTTGVTLHIGNIDKDVNEQKLMELFGKFGRVLSVKIVREMYTQESKGFGFVTVSNQQEADNAKLNLNHEKIGKKEIMISLFKKPNSSDIDPKANLIIKNLDKRVTGKQLEKLCAEFGKVVDCRIKDDSDGNSLGYGYVQFDSEASASNCLQGITSKSFYDKPLSGELFVPRSRRPAAN